MSSSPKSRCARLVFREIHSVPSGLCTGTVPAGAPYPDPDNPGGHIVTVAIADAEGSVTRQARLIGVRDWVRAGAVEMGLDCLRRRLMGLPVDERIDFERR